jgi:hypothetical protein
VTRAAVLLTLALASSTGLAHFNPPSYLAPAKSLIAMRLTAPFNEIFVHAYDEGGPTFRGTLTVESRESGPVEQDVELSVRGNSSKAPNECTFPKLKIRAGERTFKLGTHCGEREDGDLTPVLGRWGNEKSPPREALVYSLVAAAGVRTLRARVARVTYVYTDPKPGKIPDQRQPVVRNAMLLEDDEDAISRLGGDRPIGRFTDAERQFAREDALDVVLAEAMIGNLDWCLSFTATDSKRCDAHVPIYNLLAIESRNGGFPVLYDFDLSGMVAGRREWFAGAVTAAFDPPRAAIEQEILGQVQRLRSFYSRAEIDSSRRRFISRKPAIRAALEAATVDPVGRALATTYLDVFFSIIGSDEQFYG